MDTDSGEQKIVDSSMLASTAPGAPDRSFFANDWDGNGMGDAADALLDWRRYLAAHVVNSRDFTGRTWCARPSDISCEMRGTVSFVAASGSPVPLPPALPDGAPAECPSTVGARLEVSAPGLTADNQFSFPDTGVGAASAPVTFTVTNPSAVPLRVNGVDFMGGADSPDFLMTPGSCQPTPADMGRGRLLSAGGSCNFQVQFRPRHRDGIVECAAASPDESCRRRASLFVTGEVDLERTALAPINVGLSGRAIGGSLVIEPAGDICFAANVDAPGCTERHTIRVRNDGPGVLIITSAGVRGGSGADGFEHLPPYPVLSEPLPPGGTADFIVRFCNYAMGASSGADSAFTINSSDPRSPTVVVTLVNPLRLRCP
ncbi:MAG: choice-of-anchor D domain-containing protein [Acidobacteria bacterium]|nr:choice-of-anchor D domain-containing protein [Acidobacteriota bacterium]